ncbi:unnamed protein product [Microthlaspi erraticum]|uniref:Uncharacterized protein n=1 Tax=Microthlaspi erraticum TaxID=1685480 RepID=A0A6D2IXF8_9BRAS|nr:unnamed protein product [Microthlaspi erraticum]
MEFIGVGWISLSNDPMPPRLDSHWLTPCVCELDRVGTTEDLVELDFTTGRKRSQRTQRVQEEPEVLVTDTMDVPEGNGNPLGNGLGRARQTRPIGLGDAPNRHQQETRDCSTTCRTTTLRSSWE